MSVKDLDKAIALISSHRKSIVQSATGSGSSLLNVIQFTNTASETGLSLKAAFVLCYILENGSASIEQLKLAGIATTHNGSMGSMFRNGKFAEKELISKENSGYRNIGRTYKLTKKGHEVAKQLAATLAPAQS
tara:strand:+ start:887 stop:1285 length:399 start_codon:yes stop_codon:yes gene_type:complete